MSFVVHYSDIDITTKAGFGKVAHLPCILDSRPGYHRLSSRYLIDRGLGLWNPLTRGGTSRSIAPGDQTMKNYAYWLVNFLDWSEIRGVDLETCDYREHIHGRYQNEMLNGIWSRDGIALSPRTVNLRVQQACDLLIWMSDKGCREAFNVPYETVSVRGGKRNEFRRPPHKKKKFWSTRGRYDRMHCAYACPPMTKSKVGLQVFTRSLVIPRG